MLLSGFIIRFNMLSFWRLRVRELFGMVGRPPPKVCFPFKNLFKTSSFWSFRVEGRALPDGRLAAFQNTFSFQNSFYDEVILKLPFGWALPDGRPAASKSAFSFLSSSFSGFFFFFFLSTSSFFFFFLVVHMLPSSSSSSSGLSLLSSLSIYRSFVFTNFPIDRYISQGV